jgi:hypothetical protein
MPVNQIKFRSTPPRQSCLPGTPSTWDAGCLIPYTIDDVPCAALGTRTRVSFERSEDAGRGSKPDGVSPASPVLVTLFFG